MSEAERELGEKLIDRLPLLCYAQQRERD